MQFLNKLDIYCLIIFTRFNLFLSCFVLLLLLLLGYFIYMQLTLCFMVYFFLFFSFLHDQAFNVSLHIIIIIHKDKTNFSCSSSRRNYRANVYIHFKMNRLFKTHIDWYYSFEGKWIIYRPIHFGIIKRYHKFLNELHLNW